MPLNATNNASSSSRVLVTGASGYIGRHVVTECLAHGFAVRALTSKVLSETQRSDPRVEWRQIDFLSADDDAVRDVVSGCSAVLHLAAELWNISKMHRVNVETTAALACHAEASNLVFFGFTSSFTVYGSPATRIVTEGDALVTAERDVRAEFRGTASIRAYARSKVLGERVLAATACRVEYAVFRPSFVVSLSDIMAQTQRNRIQRLVLGNRHEHHIYVGDVAYALVWFMRQALSRPERQPGVATYTLADDEARRPSGATFLKYAFKRTGDARFRAAGAAPGWVYDLLDMIKNRVVTRRKPFGLVRYSCDKLQATGYRHKTGLDAAQDLALDVFRSGELVEPGYVGPAANI